MNPDRLLGVRHAFAALFRRRRSSTTPVSTASAGHRLRRLRGDRFCLIHRLRRLLDALSGFRHRSLQRLRLGVGYIIAALVQRRRSSTTPAFPALVSRFLRCPTDRSAALSCNMQCPTTPLIVLHRPTLSYSDDLLWWIPEPRESSHPRPRLDEWSLIFNGDRFLLHPTGTAVFAGFGNRGFISSASAPRRIDFHLRQRLGSDGDGRLWWVRLFSSRSPVICVLRHLSASCSVIPRPAAVFHVMRRLASSSSDGDGRL